jgi:DNA repair exonuclease SbcCD ATPase subunit
MTDRMLAARVVAACGIALMSCAALLAQPQVDADTKEILSYRLTLDGLNKFAAATRQMAESAKSDPRYREMMKLQAELDALEKKEELTEADEARAEKLQEQLEALEDSVPTGLDASDKSLSDMEASLRKEPQMARALDSAGMSARDYAKFMIAFFQAAMVHGMQKSGVVKEIPKELQATLNMENIKFVEAHQAEITALMKEFQGAAKK